MRILLTGGSGFIGRNILESEWAKRHTVFAPRHHELDLTDEDAVRLYLRRNKFDAIIHGAAKPGHRNAKDLSRLFVDNTRMFVNLARNYHDFGKMIVLGSGAIYDMRHYVPRMHEDYAGEHIPVDEHGFSKYVIYQMIEKYDNMIDLRLFGVFGKYEDYAIRFISNLMGKALFDMPLTMKQDRLFDYLFVPDLIPILDYFLVNPVKHKAYNVTPADPVSLFELAKKILKISGKKLPIQIAEEGLGTEYTADNTRLKSEIIDVRFTPLSHSMSQLYDWLTLQKDQIDVELLKVDK